MSLHSLLLACSLFLNAFGITAHTSSTDHPAKLHTIESSKIISQIQAIKKALEKTKGGLIAKTELMDESGVKKYKMTIFNQNKEFEVEVNAATGKVLKMD